MPIFLLRMRYLLLVLLGIPFSIYAQITPDAGLQKGDSIVVDNGKKDSIKIFKPTIDDYRFRTENEAYRNIDTTFTIAHSYIYTQYNNKNNFGKIQFANIGAGFQDLIFRREEKSILNLLPTNKSHSIIAPDEVKYYDVKTPTTSFLYHTAMKNGAALQSTYTQNFGKNFNFSAEYMGLRSQGFYNNSLAANNNVIVSSRYHSKNERYQLYAHFLHQNVNNEENGGIQDLSIFEGGDSRFNNRENIPVNLSDSDSRFSYRRYYLSHSFLPFNREKFPFKLAHQVYYQSNKYYVNIASADTSYFTDYDTNVEGRTKKYSKNWSNIFRLIWDNRQFYLDAGLRYQNISLGAERTNQSSLESIVFQENRIGAVGNLKINLWDRVGLHSFLEFSSGKAFGNLLKIDNFLKVKVLQDFLVDAKVNFQSATPNFNYLVNASPVTSYHYQWQNFKNENILEIGGSAGIKWLDTKFFAKYFRVDNFAYFDATGQPKQSDISLNISQIGGEATFKYNKFHFNTRLHFQSNLSGTEFFPSPKFIGLGNIYYKTPAFKNAAEIMGGIKVYYFSKFASREFSPILNEFILPSSRGYVIGNKPIVDAYINMKVKRMQFYIEGQNLTTTFMQNKVYTAPYYPFYDFRLNIGILWHLFH